MRVVHLVGEPQASGMQPCERCGFIVSEPGLAPFPAGSVEVITTRGYGGKMLSTTDDPPTCKQPTH